MLELAGVAGEPVAMDAWPGARCNRDFCVLSVERAGREWHLLMSRSGNLIEERALAAACEQADIVVSERRLPRSCRPRWLKADGRMLSETGGLAIVFDGRKVSAVAQGQGEHGWWRGYRPR
jgi:competence protein ComEC